MNKTTQPTQTSETQTSQSGGTNSKKLLILLSSAIGAAVVTIVLFVLSFVVPNGDNADKTAVLILSFAIFFGGVTAVTLSSYLELKKNIKVNHTMAIAFGGVLIAMAYGLSFIKLYELPMGGTITLVSILPICLYSYMFGTKRGIAIGLIYGILQIIQGAYYVHPVQLLLDYPLPFAALGITGCLRGRFSKVKNGAIIEIALGMAIALIARFICHVLSGVVFFADYAPEGMNPWVYSIAYNSFVFVDGVPAIIIACLMFASKALTRQINRFIEK